MFSSLRNRNYRLFAIAVGIVLIRVTGTSVRDGLRPLRRKLLPMSA